MKKQKCMKAKNFPKLMTDTTLQIQKGQTTPRKRNIKQKIIQTNYISIWGEGEFQRKNSEANQRKKLLNCREK